jgi:hypothetical protein
MRSRALTVGALFVAACAPPRVVRESPVANACLVVPPPSITPESITVALIPSAPRSAFDDAPDSVPNFTRVRPAATLVRLDCSGHVVPDAAATWSESNGRVTFTLGDDLRHADGTRLTAPEVLDRWRSSEGIPARIAAAATALDDRTIAVAGSNTELRAFADPALVVMERPNERGPRLAMITTAAAAARDRIDAGVDVLVTNDPSVADYALARGNYAVVPLTWDRTYVLLSSQRATRKGDDVSALGAALARDAVRGDVAAPTGPTWWDALSSCGASPPPSPSARATTPARRIAYLRGDAVARGLAERVAALSAMRGDRGADSVLARAAPELTSPGPSLTAIGLTRAELRGALSAASELAYVVPLPRQSLTPCRESARVFAVAPWVTAGGVVPLVDVRDRLVVRRGSVGVELGWDGSFFLVGTERE